MTQQPPRKLEMATRKKSSAAPATILIILLGLCGGGAWYMLTQQDGSSGPSSWPLPTVSELPADNSRDGSRNDTRSSSVSGGTPGTSGGLSGSIAGRTGASGDAGTGTFPAGQGGSGVSGSIPESMAEKPAVNGQASQGAAPGTGNAGRSASSAQQGKPNVPSFATGRNTAQSRGKTDSGNIVEPPAGVRSPVLVTEAPGALSGNRKGVSSPAASPLSERERRIAAVEAAVREGEQHAESAPDGTSYGMSLGGELGGTEAEDLTGSMAAEAAKGGDSVITPRFVRGLARWMVEHYTPPAKPDGKGRISASLSAANTAFGQSMSGLRYVGEDSASGRAFVLNHAWSPGMLEALYRMYDDSFVQAMRDAAAMRSKGGLDARQTADMFRSYAGRFRQLDAGLRGVAGVPDLEARVGELRKAEQETARARKELSALVRSYEAAARQGDADRVEELRARMGSSSQRIQAATSARTRAERSLAAEIRRKAGSSAPDDATLLYLAQWVERRDAGQDAAVVAADLLGRMAQRFDAEAK